MKKIFTQSKIFFYIIKNIFHDEKSISTQWNIFFHKIIFFNDENLSLHVDHYFFYTISNSFLYDEKDFLHHEEYFFYIMKIFFRQWENHSTRSKISVHEEIFYTMKKFFTHWNIFSTQSQNIFLRKKKVSTYR